ncbi:MAG: thioesterase family protein [Paracoccaceae bacterium]
MSQRYGFNWGGMVARWGQAVGEDEMTESFLAIEDGFYVGRDPARGPWSADHCHAGPVAGALARSIEQAFAGGKHLVRLTVDLVRPVPMAGFAVEVEPTRDGKRLATAQARLVGRDGKVCAMATGMLIAPGEDYAFPTAPVEPVAPFAAAEAGGFPITEALHGQPFFTNFVDLHYPPGHNSDPGPTQVWMRTLPLLADEEPSPFQRLCPLADCGNAIGRNGNLDQYRFLNTDLTIVAHRASSEDWLHSSAWSHWHRNGIGLAQAHLSDSQGPIATALQSLVLEPV